MPGLYPPFAQRPFSDDDEVGRVARRDLCDRVGFDDLQHLRIEESLASRNDISIRLRIRPLNVTMAIPWNVLVLMDEPAFPGCVLTIPAQECQTVASEVAEIDGSDNRCQAPSRFPATASGGQAV
jgi:hypothetical protein